MERKNDSLANKYRNTGNGHFRLKEYFEALIFYNRSLCVAETKESISLAYANRSAVYIKLNLFEMCLQNIQLARDNNYPPEKMETLNNRKKECEKLMKTIKPNPDDDPFNFFKLSYPPNPKYPKIVDCLELRKDKQEVHLITTRDLNTGDIIAIEEPCFASLQHNARLHRCSFCLKDQQLNLFPCSGCAMVMFCSEKCRGKALKGFHQFDCNVSIDSFDGYDFPVKFLVHCLSVFDYKIEELQKFLNTNNKTSTVFDFDFSDPDDPMYEKNMILASLSNTFGRKENFFMIKMVLRGFIEDFASNNKKFAQIWRKHSGFLVNLINSYDGFCSGVQIHAYSSKDLNLIKTDEVLKSLSLNEKRKGIKFLQTGMAAYPFIKLLNLSCDPNVRKVNISGKMIMYVCKPVKKGDEIFGMFGTSFDQTGPASERKKRLRIMNAVGCNCEACVNDWPTIAKLPSVDPFFRYEHVTTFASHDQAKKNIARNNAYIDANFKAHNPTKEVYFTITNNFFEHCGITRPSFYP